MGWMLLRSSGPIRPAIGGAHPTLRPVAQGRATAQDPPRDPLVHRQPPSKLASHESLDHRHRNPQNYISTKVVLATKRNPDVEDIRLSCVGMTKQPASAIGVECAREGKRGFVTPSTAEAWPVFTGRVAVAHVQGSAQRRQRIWALLRMLRRPG